MTFLSILSQAYIFIVKLADIIFLKFKKKSLGFLTTFLYKTISFFL